MNSREEYINLAVDIGQLKETVLSIFHTILLHRTLGKCKYDDGNKYTLGTLGLEEVDCSSIELTFVKLNSPELDNLLNKEIMLFYDDMYKKISHQKANKFQTVRSHSMNVINDVVKENYNENLIKPVSGTCVLEFYQRKNKPTVSVNTKTEGTVWERWLLNIEVTTYSGSDRLAEMKVSVGELISEKILYICSKANRSNYLPIIPKFQELNNVFDDSFSDCQPYLFRILNGPPTSTLPKLESMRANIESSARSFTARSAEYIMAAINVGDLERDNGRITELRSQVNDVTDVMSQNIRKILEREERLENAEARTANLIESSDQFRIAARSVSRQYWWKNVKWTIIMYIVGILIIVAIILIILHACNVI
uniref:Autophagy-related protein 101 n=1 Tax=Strongyloides stercoralis TaxID=6248 RepID=A0AAF5DMA2_STRER